MNEAEVRRIVNEKISEVLEGVYEAIYYASGQRDLDIRLKVLRDRIDEINRRVTNE